MERMTIRNSDCTVSQPTNLNWENVLYRLAAYEDTGLEPEDIVGLKNTCDQLNGINDILFKANQAMGKDLAEWKKAHDDGRLVVLPCKVGDMVYWLHNGFITECRVHRIQMNRTGLFICLKSKVSHGAFRVDICLGKTVFMTCEEAEADLAGKGDDV